MVAHNSMSTYKPRIVNLERIGPKWIRRFEGRLHFLPDIPSQARTKAAKFCALTNRNKVIIFAVVVVVSSVVIKCYVACYKCILEATQNNYGPTSCMVPAHILSFHNETENLCYIMIGLIFSCR